MWYSLSMRLGYVVLVRVYEVFREDRSTRVDVAPAHSHLLGEILRLPAAEFTTLPSVVLDNPLPTHLPVPEPMLLQLFPTYLSDMPSDECLQQFTRLKTAVEREVFWMVAVEL